MFKEDTIAAITTGISNAGVGIIRISGDRACEITDRVFQAENKEEKSFKYEIIYRCIWKDI